MGYQYGSHTVSNIEHHFSWVIKYHALQDDTVQHIRELAWKTCKVYEIMIILGILLSQNPMTIFRTGS